MAYRAKKTNGPSLIVPLDGEFVTLKGPDIKWGSPATKSRKATEYIAKQATQKQFKALMETPFKALIEEYDKKEEPAKN